MYSESGEPAGIVIRAILKYGMVWTCDTVTPEMYSMHKKSLAMCEISTIYQNLMTTECTQSGEPAGIEL